MINIPDSIKELYRSNNLNEETRKKIKLSFYEDEEDTLYPYETLFPDENLFPSEHGDPWLVIENDRIDSESLSITESLSESEDLKFGSCESATMEIIVADVLEDVTEREFVLTTEIGGYEMPLGIYTVESFVRQADRRKRKITAYDRMRRFDVDVSNWYNSLKFPLTLREFRYSLCDYIGIYQETIELPLDGMEIQKNIEPSEISGRDVLSAICEINGCFGHINKMGNLHYVFLQQTGLYPSEDLFPAEDLYPSEYGSDGVEIESIRFYKSASYEDYLIDGISGVNIREQEGDVGASVGYGDNPYVVEGNFLVYGKGAVELLNIANELYESIYGRTYRPAKIECYAMPWVEVGDVVQFQTRDDFVETFVMKRVTKGCQAMMDSIESTGSKQREETFGINKQIIQLEGKTAVVVKNVEEISVTVSDLKKDTQASFKVLSDSITAEVTRATDAENTLSSSIKQTSDSITAEVTRATKAEGTLSSQIKQNADSIALKVSKGDVSSQISVESGGVNITGNRFSWSATNSSMTDDGTLTCKNANITGKITSNEANITGGKINITSADSGTPIIQMKDTSSSYGGSAANINALFAAFKKYDGSEGTISSTYIQIRKADDSWPYTFRVGGDDGKMYVKYEAYFYSDLSCYGNKNRIIKTKDFGDVLQYSYETPSPMFGDVGTGKVGEDSLCYIYFDPVFAETVSTNCTYQVFLQSEAEGNIWVKEKNEEYFVVAGTPNLSFSWEAKAKQRDYEYERLEVFDDQPDETLVDYAALANAYLANYEKELLDYEEIDQLYSA